MQMNCELRMNCVLVIELENQSATDSSHHELNFLGNTHSDQTYSDSQQSYWSPGLCGGWLLRLISVTIRLQFIVCINLD